jgi:hypothetical protein
VEIEVGRARRNFARTAMRFILCFVVLFFIYVTDSRDGSRNSKTETIRRAKTETIRRVPGSIPKQKF